MKNLILKMVNRLFLIFIALIFFILIIEAFLYVSGAIYSFKNLDSHIVVNSSSYRILCIGASHTAGDGAPANLSYPSQLQAKLRKYYRTEKIDVINKAVPSYNSHQLKSKLKQELIDYKPHLVILRTGEPNFWNFTGKEDLFNPTYLSTLVSRFKIYKLITYLRHILRKKDLPNATFTKKLGLNILITNPPPEPTNFDYRAMAKACSIGDWLMNYPKTPDKEEVIKQAIQYLIYLGQEDPKYFETIARIYQHYIRNPSEAIKWYMWATIQLGYFPDQGQFWDYAYQLSKLRSEVGIVRGDDLFNSFYNELERLHPELLVHFIGVEKNLSGDLIKKWIKDDIEEMIQMIRENNSKVIIHNYAPQPPKVETPYPAYKMANKILETVAKEQRLYFVDQHLIFTNFFQKPNVDRNSYYYREFDIIDSHLNEKGYAIMAENLLEYIVEKNILNL